MQELHKIGYAHNDAHGDNFMKDSKNKNIHIIDPETIKYQQTQGPENFRNEILVFIEDITEQLPYEIKQKIKKIPRPTNSHGKEEYS